MSDPTREYALTLNASMDYADAIAILLRKGGETRRLATPSTGRHLPTDLPFADGTDWAVAASALASAINLELMVQPNGVLELAEIPVKVTIADVLAALTERVAMHEVIDFEDVITRTDRVTVDGDSPEMVEVLTIRWKRAA